MAIPVFVINLDDATARLESMARQLDALGMAWQRIPAVDGRLLDADIIREENKRARPRPLSTGETGCLHSHLSIWRRIAQGSEPAALVLEDDMLLSADTAAFVQDIAWLPKDSCIVRLETFRMPVAFGKAVAWVRERGIHPLHSAHFGAGAYIMTRACAAKLTGDYERQIDTADLMLFKNPATYNVHQVSPAPCIQQGIHQYGRRRQRMDSSLHAEREHMMQYSWADPCVAFRRIYRKLTRAYLIVSAAAKGAQVRTIPFA